MEHLNESNFNDKVTNAKGVQLVDFYAEWCGPCKMLTPVIEKLAAEFEGKAGIYKVNVDEAPGLAAQFGVRGVPTVILFKDGNAAETIVGFKEFDDLKSLIDSSL